MDENASIIIESHAGVLRQPLDCHIIVEGCGCAHDTTFEGTYNMFNAICIMSIIGTPIAHCRYRYEVRQRKLLYNKLQEMKGNIRVFCRVRHDDRVTCALEFPDQAGLGSQTHVRCPNPRDPRETKEFTFDTVFAPTSSQEDVFEDTEPIMTSCVDGYVTRVGPCTIAMYMYVMIIVHQQHMCMNS